MQTKDDALGGTIPLPVIKLLEYRLGKAEEDGVERNKERIESAGSSREHIVAIVKDLQG
jgi:hypothetical protein